jgi:hypothetical protein
MFNFEKLDVWQEAIQFADLVDELTGDFPGEELRIDESDAACRCVDFVESGRGKFTCIADRFQPVCRNCDGISIRGRFAIHHRASAKNNRAERLQSNLRSS